MAIFTQSDETRLEFTYIKPWTQSDETRLEFTLANQNIYELFAVIKVR